MRFLEEIVVAAAGVLLALATLLVSHWLEGSWLSALLFGGV